MKQSLLNLPFVICFFLCGLSFESGASHVVGSDITYKCTSTPGIYEITFVFYRDCTGIPFENCSGGCGSSCTTTILIQGADPNCSGITFGTVALSLVSVRDADQQPYCANSKNICSNMGCAAPGTYTPSVERYEFKGFANIGNSAGIPNTCCNVRLVKSISARNNNNVGSGGQNFYTDAIINRCLAIPSPCNSSPEFKTDPFIIVCGNNPVVYNNAAFDPDGDSLSFAFAPALQAFGTSVTYNAPFAYDKPMPWSGNASNPFPEGIHCDPATGDIMFSPPNSYSMFTGVLVIEVKQWKKINGIPTHIGTTRRDIQMTIRGDCPTNHYPIITTSPYDSAATIPKTRWEVCAGEQLCFTVTATDSDFNPPAISDTTYLSWDATIAGYGATFLPTYNQADRKKPSPLGGPRQDQYQFCWTPHPLMDRADPYIFSILATDSRCPDPGRIRRGFSIKVIPLPYVSISKTNKRCGTFQIGYTNHKVAIPIASSTLQIAKTPNDFTFANGSYTYNNISSSPDLIFTQPGKYLIRLSVQNGNCPSILYDTLMVDTPFTVNTKDITVCEGTRINLNAQPTFGTPPFSYRWYRTAADTLSTPLNSPNFSTPSFPFTLNQSENFYLVAKDNAGCSVHANLSANVIKHISSIDIRNLSCFGSNNGNLTVHLTDSTPAYQYRLDSGAFQSSNVFNNLAAGNYSITVKDSANCRSSQTLQIKQPSLLKDTLITVKDESCVGMNNGSFEVHATGGTKPYTFGLDSIVFKPDTLYSSLVPRSYTMHIFDSNNCYVKLTRTIAAADSLHYTATLKNPLCGASANGEIRVSGTGGKKPYLHKIDGNPFIADSIFKNLSAKTYALSIRDANGCEVSFNALLTAPAPVLGTVTPQHATCFGSATGSALALGSGGTPPYQYRTNGGAYNASGIFNNLTAGNYTFEIKDSLNCIHSIQQAIAQPSAIAVTITGTPTSCFENTDGAISIHTTGGVKPYRFSLDSVSFQTDSVISNLAKGAYSVYILDSVACSKKIPATITAPVKVSATTLITPVSCFGRTDGKITVTPVSGKTPFMFSLNGNAFVAGNAFSNLGATTHAVIVKDSIGCRDTIHAVITAPAPIVIGSITGPNTSPVNVSETYSIAPQPGLSYKWAALKGIVTSDDTSATAIIRWDTTGVGRVGVALYKDTACGDTTSMLVTIGTSGLSELARSWGLAVYPNPAKSILNISLEKLPQHQTIQLLDVQGKLVLQQELKLSQQLDLEKLTPGIYILKIGEWSGQVVKE